ncbi:MAG: hypothetical protein HY898_13860 [Deltaproteobacteria bacterium]|nr:hypothetical protein [Deltaproteobacteria bacterium]
MRRRRRPQGRQEPAGRSARIHRHAALWKLLGEMSSLEPRRAFTRRLLGLADTRQAEAPRASCAPRVGAISGHALEQFGDFPPGSLGWLLFALGGG